VRFYIFNSSSLCTLFYSRLVLNVCIAVCIVECVFNVVCWSYCEINYIGMQFILVSSLADCYTFRAIEGACVSVIGT